MTSANQIYQSVLAKLDHFMHYGTTNILAVAAVGFASVVGLVVYICIHFISNNKLNAKGRPSESKSSKPVSAPKEKVIAPVTTVKKKPKVEKKKEEEPKKKVTAEVAPAKVEKAVPVKESVKAAKKTEVTPKQEKSQKIVAPKKNAKSDEVAAGEWITVVSKKDKKQQVRPNGENGHEVAGFAVAPAAVSLKADKKVQPTKKSKTPASPRAAAGETEKPKIATETKPITAGVAEVGVESIAKILPKEVTLTPELRAMIAQMAPKKPQEAAAPTPPKATPTPPKASGKSVKEPPTPAPATSKAVLNGHKKAEPATAKAVKSSEVTAVNASADVDPGWTEIRPTKKRNKARKE